MDLGKRVTCILAALAFALTATAVTGEPVRRDIQFVKKSKLTVPKKYTFRFSLWDAADPEDPAGVMLWSEEKVKKLKKTTFKHGLGSVDPEGNPMAPELFTRQLWVQVDRWVKRTAAWKRVGGRTRLKMVAYALSGDPGEAGSVGGDEIADGSVKPGDLEDGAVLVEILDDDGAGSGLDADLLDGNQAVVFAPMGHEHDSDYVQEGQDGSVTGGMIADGTLEDVDFGPGAAVTGDKLGPIQSPGKVADQALSGSVLLLAAHQTLTAVKHFEPSAGGVPFAVAGTKTGTVINLTAEKAESALLAGKALEADSLGGLASADLESRYTPSAALQVPRANSIATPDTTGDTGWYTSMTIGADGLPVISHHDYTSGDLKVAKCNDPACSGGDETISTIESAGDTGLYTAIIIGRDGLPVISYLDFTEFVLKVARCNDAACSGGDETISVVDPRVAVGWYTSMTIGPGGFPVISYYDVTRADLKVAACNDAACAGGDETVTAVDSAEDTGWDTSIAIGADGFPVISYYDITGSALKVAKCNDAACAGEDELITILDSAGDVGWETSIAVGADGFPVISYYDVSNTALKVAKCNDAACAGGDELITTLDSGGDVGRHSSITVGPGGFPVVSYYDGTNAALKIARCNDPACTGGDELIATLDQGDRGTYSSVTIGTDGFPLVSYRDAGNGILRVFKAANPFMTDFWTRR